MIGFTFPPRGWALCNGQLLGKHETSALFRNDGSDEIETCAVSDLEDRIANQAGVVPEDGAASTTGYNGRALHHAIVS